MTILHAAADTTYAYVDREGTMHEMLAWMAPADRLAIDIEADSLYHYHEKVCLAQLTVRGRNFVVDPLAKLDLGPFLGALADQTLVLHGADYDLRMLRSSFGFRPRSGVIDTMMAAQLLGCEKLGLSSLVEQFSGQTLSQGGQKSDWSRRPLSPAQLRYAVDDTRYLEPLADRLLAELSRLGRRHWFEQGCEAAIEATVGDREADPDRQWRIKGVRDLTRSQAAFARELWRWREREARRSDRPPFKILGDAGLLELAAWAERHPRAGLAQAPRLPRDFRGVRLESLREAIHRASRIGPSDWPEPRLRLSGKRQNPGEGFGCLRDDVARLAADLGLQPSVIAPRTALEEISRRRPTDVAGIQQAGRLLRWQAELLAPVVWRALGVS
ncbi:MAG TPA: HRDC domain-containing protein [Phycisphaerae bacterium]|nr:HRDC domain-containing protein [Phycisphaerae bacterium]